jgi:hypothetical protein
MPLSWTTWTEQITRKGLSGCQKLTIAETPEQGRYLLANSDICAGDRFELPNHRQLFVDLTVVSSSTLWPVLEDLVDREHVPISKDIVAVALFLLSKLSKGNRSDGTWGHLFAALPESFDTLLFWNKEQLINLQGTRVLHDREAMERQYKTL